VDGLRSVDAQRQYLGHSHEAMFAAERPPIGLYMHTADAGSIDTRATFTRRHHLDEDFEVIPIPGHTPGSTAYLFDTGEHRVLFTADTLLLDGGVWRTAVLASSDRSAYAESLRTIGELDFDLLVPWAAVGPFTAATDRDDTRRRIGALLRDL
jgi:glyoxylase-like metal-dependent hydrolase (beta-lactamase superfamily II)